jgi:hypothetical protein
MRRQFTPRQPTLRQPTLLNSCASAATAAEARFRIDYPEVAPRASRIIALDERAAALVHNLADQHWSGGHFLVFEAPAAADGAADAMLRTADGAPVLLSSELDNADTAVMIATADASAPAAAVIGDACAARRIMSAGLVISDGGDVDDVVAAMRPNAMVLVILQNHHDVPEILSALRV